MIVEINAQALTPGQVRAELSKYGISLPDNHDFKQFVKYKIDTELGKIIEVEKLFTSATQWLEKTKETIECSNNYVNKHGLPIDQFSPGTELTEAEKEAYIQGRFENIDEDYLMDGKEFRRELDALDEELEAKVAKAVQDNPDLPKHFIVDCILAEEDAELERLEEYKRRSPKGDNLS